LPGVFHCTAGKDRTGILAAVLLSAFGVLEEDILADYLLTAESREARYEWLAIHDPDYLVFLQTLPPSALEVRTEAVELMLDAVREEHGSAANYLIAGGLDPTSLERLTDELLES
jgi:protein-tyrosine phosphatase